MPVFNRFAQKQKAPTPQDAAGDDLEDVARQRLTAQPGGTLAGQAAPRASDTDASSQIRQGIGVATGATPSRTNTVDQNATGVGAQVGGFQTAAPNGANHTNPNSPPAAGDGLDEVARVRLQQEQERAAREADLKASKARALQQADARAGLAGFGLSGGAAALHGDVSRVQDRGITEDLANLNRTQQADLRATEDQKFKDLQRLAAIDALEEEKDVDLNKDGLVSGQKVGGTVGDGNPDNDADPNAKPKPAGYDHEQNFAGNAPDRHDLDPAWAGHTGDFVETTEHGNNVADRYLGSDAKYDYYEGWDQKKWKVARAKAGSPGVAA